MQTGVPVRIVVNISDEFRPVSLAVNKYALRAIRRYSAQSAAIRIDPIPKWRVNLPRQFSERIIAELHHQVNVR